MDKNPLTTSLRPVVTLVLSKATPRSIEMMKRILVVYVGQSPLGTNANTKKITPHYYLFKSTSSRRLEEPAPYGGRSRTKIHRYPNGGWFFVVDVRYLSLNVRISIFLFTLSGKDIIIIFFRVLEIKLIDSALLFLLG